MTPRRLQKLLAPGSSRVRGAVVVIAVLAALAAAALGYFTSTGNATAVANVGSLPAPTITSATPGAGTVALNWSSVSAPAAGNVTYYVSRAGGTVGGNCPSSQATATTTTSCTDSGLTKGTYTYTVTAVWQSWTTTSSSTSVSVSFGALDHFAVSAPATATAGTAFTATITAQDVGNNTITSYSGSQALAFSGPASSPSGTRPSYPASVSFTNGVGSATVTLYDSQSTTLTATQGSASGTSGTITVAAAANHEIGASASSPQTAGTAFNVTLTAEDSWGNPTGNLSGTKSVTFSGPSNSPNTGPTYPATATFSGGNAIASVVLYDAQSTTITATDTTDGFSGVPSSSIVINPASANSFSVPTPTAQSAGAAFNETVTALDAYGNVATGYTGSQAITFSGPSSSPSGATPSYPASVTFASGVGTASITLVDVQSTTLTATQGSITGTTGSFSVGPGAASSFTVPTPGPQTAGVAFNVTLTAYDAYGNIATGYTGSKTIAFTGPSNSPNNTAPTYPASVSFTNGSGTASITLVDVQSTTLTATQGAASGTSGSFAVSAGGVNRLGFTSAAVSGATSSTANLGPITVQEQDRYGNPTTAAETVTLSSSSGNGVFSASQFGTAITTVTIPSGQSSASFYYGDQTAGSPTITASATGLTSGSQAETITTAPAGLGMALAPGSTGTPSISCGSVGLSYTCAVTGVGNAGHVVFYATFVNSSGSPVAYSSTQPSTITESGQNSGTVTIGAGASSSSPSTLTASHTGNSTKTSTLTFGPYTLTITVSS